MKVCFICADKERELGLATTFLEGVKLSGDEPTMLDKGEFKRSAMEDDVYCMVGVKSHALFQRVREAGKQVVFFDKGYLRHRSRASRIWEYWRVAVNTHHPADYVERASHLGTRWQEIAKRRKIERQPWRSGTRVLYAGSSLKYHTFSGLPHPTEYAEKVIREIKSHTRMDVVYRPKPTWTEATPIEGAIFSRREVQIQTELERAHCLVTNGSNACFEAVLAGVPCIILGDAIARPISSRHLKEVAAPYLASDEAVEQWLYNTAWCMFTEEEMAAGLAWRAVKPQLEGGFVDESLLDCVVLPPQRPSKAQRKRGKSRKHDLQSGILRRPRKNKGGA